MLGLQLQILVLVLLREYIFNGFKVDITQLVQPKRLEELSSLTKLILIDGFVDLLHREIQSTEDPLVDESGSLLLGFVGHLVGEFGESKLERLPDLIAELPVADNSEDI